MMSQCVTDGLFLAARVFIAGQFRFIDLAGPPLGMGMGTEAVQFLKDQGLEFTPQGLRRQAHLFGWLWDWSDQWEERLRSMVLKNMDGDDLLWHVASFAIKDASEVQKALSSRHDVELDGEEFHWMQHSGKAAQTMHGPVHLAKLELIGEELIVTANSADRLDKARQWIDQIPGVTFQHVRTRAWNEPEGNLPPDDAMEDGEEPMEMTPELIAMVQEKMDRHYMDWIDQPLPILQGQTPRQACQTAEGRQQVGALIRTIPAPMGQAPITVPRSAMLQELGLVESTCDEPKAPKRRSVPHFEGRIGRNDPCPCGSGKKYKKCCGE